MEADTMTKPAAGKDLYAMGEIPPLGHIPAQMHCWAKKAAVLVCLSR